MAKSQPNPPKNKCDHDFKLFGFPCYINGEVWHKDMKCTKCGKMKRIRKKKDYLIKKK